jgi:hypothetical protein
MLRLYRLAHLYILVHSHQSCRHFSIFRLLKHSHVFLAQNCLSDYIYNVQRYCWNKLLTLSTLIPICLTTFLMQAANDCDLEPVAYEFFTQAFILYEEEIAVCPDLPLFGSSSALDCIINIIWHACFGTFECLNTYVLSFSL